MLLSQALFRPFSTLQVKINRNPLTSDLQVLEANLPAAETKQPELFFPEVVKATV
jgi:ribosomal protein L22